METQIRGDSQAKIKIRLAILPEGETNNSDKRLAGEITTRIANSHLLNQAQGYKVEVLSTGKQGELYNIVIWILETIATTGTAVLVQEGLKEVSDIIKSQNDRIVIDKVADLTKKIREILNDERYRKRQASIKVQFSPAVIGDIYEPGNLADILAKVGEQLTKASSDPKLPRKTGNIEISFSIKVSHKNSK